MRLRSRDKSVGGRWPRPEPRYVSARRPVPRAKQQTQLRNKTMLVPRVSSIRSNFSSAASSIRSNFTHAALSNADVDFVSVGKRAKHAHGDICSIPGTISLQHGLRLWQRLLCFP